MIALVLGVVLLAQDAPAPLPQPAAPVPVEPAVPVVPTPVETKPDASDPRLGLEEVLERAGIETVNSLEREVKSLQQTLDGLVLADGESNMKILGAKGAEDDLESFGVDDAVARQVRRLLDEVRSKRARLALLDLRGASSNNPNEGLRTVVEAAAAIDEQAKLPPSAAPVEDVLPDVLAGPSPDAQRESAIAYRDRDVKTVLALLAEVPVSRMSAQTLWIFGSCLMSERRYADAKPVFEQLQKDDEHGNLAQGAKQQLRRIEFLVNGLVDQGPDSETQK